MLKALALPLFALAVPFAAHAQDVAGQLTFGYAANSFNPNGGDTAAVGIDGDIKIGFGNGWSVGVAGNRVVTTYFETTSSDADYETTRHELAADVAYTFANGAWVGGYVGNVSFTDFKSPISYSMVGYGVEGGMNFGGADLAAFKSIGGEFDSFGLTGSYAAANYLVGASFAQTKIDASKLEAFGVAGAYQFNQAFGAFAGATSTSFGNDEIVAVGLGGTYTYTGAQVPVIASLELSNVDFSDTSADTVRLGLSIPLGKQAATFIPAGSVAATALDPAKNIVANFGFGVN